MKLRYAIENRRGAVLLAGPAGVCKTMLLQLFASEAAAEFRPYVHVVFPQMSSRELLVYLAEQLGAPPVESPRYTTEESVRRLETTLRQNTENNRHAVVVIDEAHVSPELRAFAIDAFTLRERARSDGFVVLEAGR